VSRRTESQTRRSCSKWIWKTTSRRNWMRGTTKYET